jgi:hypothetical protein
MKTLKVEDIKRIGNYIKLGQGRTATEGNDGLNTLTIREKGKVISRARGSSLSFSEKLTDEDKRYLAALGSDSK